MTRTRGRPFDYWLYLGILASFAYLTLGDGSLRLLTGDDRLRVVRDVIPILMILAGLQYLVARRPAIPKVPLLGGLVLLLALVAVQVLNPANISTRGTILAMRPHVEWIPFFVFGFVALRSAARLEGLAVVLIICASVNAGVTLVQSGLTPQQLGSWGPGYSELVGSDDELNPVAAARVYVDDSGEERVRPPGLGADGGTSGILGMIAVPLALAVFLGTTTRWRRQLALGALPLLVAGVLASQVRIGVVATVAATLVFFALIPRRPSVGVSPRALGVVAAALAAVVLVSLQGIDLQRLDSISPDQLVSSATSERGTSFGLAGEYLVKYPFGAGLGTAGPGSVTRASRNAGELSGENSFAYLIVEVGVPGLVLIMYLLGVTFVRGRRAIRAAGARDLQVMLAGYVAFLGGCGILWFGGGVTAGPPLATLIWTVAGVISYRELASRGAPVIDFAVAPSLAHKRGFARA